MSPSDAGLGDDLGIDAFAEIEEILERTALRSRAGQSPRRATAKPFIGH